MACQGASSEPPARSTSSPEKAAHPALAQSHHVRSLQDFRGPAQVRRATGVRKTLRSSATRGGRRSALGVRPYSTCCVVERSAYTGVLPNVRGVSESRRESLQTPVGWRQINPGWGSRNRSSTRGTARAVRGATRTRKVPVIVAESRGRGGPPTVRGRKTPRQGGQERSTGRPSATPFSTHSSAASTWGLDHPRKRWGPATTVSANCRRASLSAPSHQLTLSGHSVPCE